jgi:intron-binding protein aquarius
MPPAKRLKSSVQSRSQGAAAQAKAASGDNEGEAEFASLAKQHWLKTSKRTAKVKVKNDVLKREIWDTIEKEGFQFKSLLALEGLQTLERSVNIQVQSNPSFANPWPFP